MTTSQLKQLEKNALANNNIAKRFTNGKLAATFDTNEQAISDLKNIAFKTRGVYEELENCIMVTTPKDTVHKLYLIK